MTFILKTELTDCAIRTGDARIANAFWAWVEQGSITGWDFLAFVTRINPEFKAVALGLIRTCGVDA